MTIPSFLVNGFAFFRGGGGRREEEQQKEEGDDDVAMTDNNNVTIMTTGEGAAVRITPVNNNKNNKRKAPLSSPRRSANKKQRRNNSSNNNNTRLLLSTRPTHPIAPLSIIHNTHNSLLLQALYLPNAIEKIQNYRSDLLQHAVRKRLQYMRNQQWMLMLSTATATQTKIEQRQTLPVTPSQQPQPPQTPLLLHLEERVIRRIVRVIHETKTYLLQSCMEQLCQQQQQQQQQQQHKQQQDTTLTIQACLETLDVAVQAGGTSFLTSSLAQVVLRDHSGWATLMDLLRTSQPDVAAAAVATTALNHHTHTHHNNHHHHHNNTIRGKVCKLLLHCFVHDNEDHFFAAPNSHHHHHTTYNNDTAAVEERDWNLSLLDRLLIKDNFDILFPHPPSSADTWGLEATKRTNQLLGRAYKTLVANRPTDFARRESILQLRDSYFAHSRELFAQIRSITDRLSVLYDRRANIVQDIEQLFRDFDSQQQRQEQRQRQRHHPERLLAWRRSFDQLRAQSTALSEQCNAVRAEMDPLM